MSFNEEEMMERHFRLQREYANSQIEKSKDLIENFKKLTASKGIILDDNAFSYVQTIGIVASAPNLARILLGNIQTERDGLFVFDDIAKVVSPSPHQEGLFVCNDYIIMADPCYRRQMYPMANWAPRFIALFWQLNSPDITKYIAIDENRVRIDIDSHSFVELDTWYGAPFNEDISKIKNGTTKLRPPLDIDSQSINNLFAETYCLDINWSERDQVKTFQAVEIKSQDVQVVMDEQVFYPVRYLHAEFDLIKGEFRHFDGAIQFFTEDEYFKRRDSDFNMVFKSIEHIKARSRKVFKLNGSISVELWVEFCCHFFAKDPLVFEYFTGKYPEHITNSINRMRTNANIN
ncbi:TPA: hypothetical protein U5E24_002587 [Yersinia enterocolitica]|nr:hypothetical protein [Yersinia enterocolitica]